LESPQNSEHPINIHNFQDAALSLLRLPTASARRVVSIPPPSIAPFPLLSHVWQYRFCRAVRLRLSCRVFRTRPSSASHGGLSRARKWANGNGQKKVRLHSPLLKETLMFKSDHPDAPPARGPVPHPRHPSGSPAALASPITIQKAHLGSSVRGVSTGLCASAQSSSPRPNE
jgi:hypothetical protein